MAQIHNQLRRGTLSAALTAAVGDTRGAAGIERFGETLQPEINLWQLPEWAFLRAERIVAASRSGPAVAGENAAVALVNPNGSEALIVVEQISLDAGSLAASTVMVVSLVLQSVAEATLSTPAFGIGKDGRFIGTGVTIGFTISGSDAAAIGSASESVRVPAGNMPVSRGVPWVLPPGFAIVAQLSANNTSMIVNFVWRERRAWTSELPNT